MLVTIFENALKTAYTERIKYFVKVSQYYVEDRNYYYGCQNEVVRIIAELSGGEIALLQEAYQAEVEKSTIKADPNYKTGLIADSEEKTTLAALNSEEEVRRIGIALLMGKALLGITQGRRLKGTSIRDWARCATEYQRNGSCLTSLSIGFIPYWGTYLWWMGGYTT